MLNKVDKVIKNFLISEDVADNGRINFFYTTNDFYMQVLAPAADKHVIRLYKENENTFVCGGAVGELKKFFSSIKVTKDYLENPKDFLFYDPMFCYGDTKQRFPIDATDGMEHLSKYGVPTGLEDGIANGGVIRGRWFGFAPNQDNRFLKSIKPTDIDKTVFKKLGVKDDQIMFVQFQISVGLHGNSSWGRKESVGRHRPSFC